MRPRKPDPPERVEFDHFLLDLRLRALFDALSAGPVPERLLRLAQQLDRQLDESLARRHRPLGD